MTSLDTTQHSAATNCGIQTFLCLLFSTSFTRTSRVSIVNDDQQLLGTGRAKDPISAAGVLRVEGHHDDVSPCEGVGVIREFGTGGDMLNGNMGRRGHSLPRTASHLVTWHRRTCPSDLVDARAVLAVLGEGVEGIPSCQLQWDLPDCNVIENLPQR